LRSAVKELQDHIELPLAALDDKELQNTLETIEKSNIPGKIVKYV
jgi:hypothetical protein